MLMVKILVLKSDKSMNIPGYFFGGLRHADPMAHTPAASVKYRAKPMAMGTTAGAVATAATVAATAAAVPRTAPILSS